MTNSTDPSARPRRTWPRRIVVIVTLLTLGFVGVKLQQGRSQRETIRWIKEAGGSVHPDPINSTRTWEMLNLFPVQIDRVNVRDAKDISPLANMKSITSLEVFALGAKDLAPLSLLTRLESLYLYRIEGEDVTPLSNLKNLKRLTLARSNVRDISPL